MKSTLLKQKLNPFHVALIMDGNGRWATQRSLPRIEGHKRGIETVRRVVEAAPLLGITTMTVYAFSSDNWKRPVDEVNQLMSFFYDYLRGEKDNCIRQGIRLSVIGRRDRLSLPLRAAIHVAERATQRCDRLHFRIAIDYSSRDSILRAISKMGSSSTSCTRETFASRLGEAMNDRCGAPDVDLLIRTAGEKRLSDFLLWECAYAEFFFTDRLWPEFSTEDLKEAVEDFQRRVRRFGAVPAAMAS